MDNKNSCIPEKNIVNALDDIPIDIFEKILKQMKKSICKIEFNNGGNGTGFFCIIPFPDKCHQLKVLITNFHVIKKEDILKDNKIKFTIDNKLNFEIKNNEYRKIYSNEELDVTIIEIKENDNIDMESFLEIDDKILEENPNDAYKGKSIYLIGYPEGEKQRFANGLLKDID